MKAQPQQVMNEEQAVAQAKRDIYRRNRDLADLQFILSDERGRRWMWKHLGAAGCFTGGFIQNGSEAYYRTGRRDFGLALMQELNTSFLAAFLLMQQEGLTLQLNEIKEAQPVS